MFMAQKLSALLSFFVCFVLAVLPISAEIRTIHSLDELPIDAISKKTLVLFDLDDVLLYPRDGLMQNWRAGWKPEGAREWTAEEDTIAWTYLTFQLMDPLGPSMIELLNAKEIPAIGFTSFAMDDLSSVLSIPDWRFKHVQELGLNFKAGLDVVFSVQEGFIPPSFEKGILYCGNMYKKDKDNKGKVLSLYLDSLDWIPEQVVLVDDGKAHLEAVQKELNRRGIPFLGFLYVPKALDPIDENIAKLQYETLMLKKLWLSDEEARAIQQVVKK